MVVRREGDVHDLDPGAVGEDLRVVAFGLVRRVNVHGLRESSVER